MNEAFVTVPAFRGMSVVNPGADLSRPLLIENAYTENGSVFRREPAWLPDDFTAAGAGASCVGLFGVRDAVGRNYLVRVVQDTSPTEYNVYLYRGIHFLGSQQLTTYSGAATPQPDAWFTHAMVNGHLYLTNGQSGLFRITDFESSDLSGGMRLETVTALDRDTHRRRLAGDDHGPYMSVVPRGRLILAHMGRLFHAGDPHDPQLLRWSNLYDPRAYPYPNFFYVGGGDGWGITGIAPFGTDINGGVLIFTEHHHEKPEDERG